MFSMALIPCPTHDSCDLCSKKIIYVQMWREKVTSLIAKTSCDWYKFNIRGHFPTPGGALWLVYPGQLPENRAGSHGEAALQTNGPETAGADRKELLRQGWEPPYLPDCIWFTPNPSLTPCTTAISWQEYLQKLLTRTKILSRKVDFESYIQNKGTAIKGMTWTSQTVTFFCVLHSDLLKQIDDNRFFLLFIVSLPSDFSIALFFKI